MASASMHAWCPLYLLSLRNQDCQGVRTASLKPPYQPPTPALPRPAQTPRRSGMLAALALPPAGEPRRLSSQPWAAPATPCQLPGPACEPACGPACRLV
ncbi:hypothetical protein V8C86DRAFT_2508739 [Haematococcus lacustris]